MKRLAVLALIVLGSCLSTPTPRPQIAQTYYLDATLGNDANAGTQAEPWLTLKKAVASIQSGDTVILAGGIYYPFQSPFVFGPAGTPSNLTTFKAAPGARAIITRQDERTPAKMSAADYVRIEGLWIGGTFDPTVTEAFVVGHYGAQLIGNTFFGWYSGVLCGWCEATLIQDNRFVNDGYDVHNHGIYISTGLATNGNLTNHVIIDHNLFVGGDGYGFQGWHGPKNLIASRNIVASQMWGAAFDGTDNWIYGNLFWNERGDGTLQPWGLFVSNKSNVIEGNLFGPHAWFNLSNGSQMLSYQKMRGNSYTDDPYPPGTGGSVCKAPGSCNDSSGAILHRGQESLEIGMEGQDLDATIAALAQAFNQPAASLLTDVGVEQNFAKFEAIRLPPAPADFWSAFRALGLAEYDRFGNAIGGTPTWTPTVTETSTPQGLTQTPTPSYTPVVVPSDTPTEVVTSSPTVTNTPTEIPTSTLTETPTFTPSPTATDTPIPTPTETPTATPTRPPWMWNQICPGPVKVIPVDGTQVDVQCLWPEFLPESGGTP